MVATGGSTVFMFLYYGNEESDEVINSSIKTIKH